MYTIKRAAEQVGVSVSTLRSWERRYGIGSPRRTESGYRVYDDRAVRELVIMQSLVAEGWSVRAAAEETLQRALAPTTQATTAPDQTLVEVADSFDVAGLAALLDERFSTASFEAVVDGWLLPALHDLGSAWESGRVSVAGEHFVSYGVARRLSAAYEAAGGDAPLSDTAPGVVLGLPPGSRHELGLLSFATAARRLGLSTTYVGADVPADAWQAAVTTRPVASAVLALSSAEHAEPLAEVVSTITAARPGTLVAVGGDAQDLAPPQCLRLGHRVGPAAAMLAAHLAADRTGPVRA